MKLDRRKNAIRGMAFGTINNIIIFILPFIAQTVLIRRLGIDYIGIKGLFSSILVVLSLAEMGIGAAMVYNMYKPIAEDDIKTLGALLNTYKKIYRVIGAVVLMIGLAIFPNIDRFIKGDYPEGIDLKIIFILYLINSVLSYWLLAYKSALLNAYQRNDILQILSAVSNICLYVGQIIILFLFNNFYMYLTIAIIITVMKNIATSIVVDKLYPDIICIGEISKELKKNIITNVSGLFIGKLAGVTRNTFDSIFISAFIGISQTAIYSNYYMIMTSVASVTAVVIPSLLAGVGNSIVLESTQKNFKDMMYINWIYMIFSGVLASFMLCLYQPFMLIWVGDDAIFPTYIMILFPIYFYVSKLGDIRSIYSDAAGLFWENRYRNIIETIANIVLNYTFVKLFGVLGILLATIITMFFIAFMGSTIIIFKYYFKEGLKEYLFSQLKLMGLALMVAFFSYMIVSRVLILNYLIAFLVKFIICVMIIPTAYWICIHKSEEFIRLMNAIRVRK